MLGETTFSPNRFVRENKYNPKLYEKTEIICKSTIIKMKQIYLIEIKKLVQKYSLALSIYLIYFIWGKN